MQRSRKFFSKYCPLRNWVGAGIFSALLLLGASLSHAEETVAVEKVFVVIHEMPHVGMRNPLLFVNQNIGTREHSNAWFSVRADYSQFPYQDEFCQRCDAGVIGLKAVFSF